MDWEARELELREDLLNFVDAWHNRLEDDPSLLETMMTHYQITEEEAKLWLGGSRLIPERLLKEKK